MTDTTNTTDTMDTKAPKKKAQPSTIEHSAAIALYAKAKGVSASDAGKAFRRTLRSTEGWKLITKNDPTQYGPKGKVKREPNDKRPWGTHKRSTLKQLGLLK